MDVEAVGLSKYPRDEVVHDDGCRVARQLGDRRAPVTGETAQVAFGT